ncbi:hypothetical protein GCM10010406_11140 [Streptomyces thermolineatus]|uniref:Uncharacterized protein n=1 Tax=Streptomyces thermolineatus TaxID=44033 RepID=A0ABN3L2S1_9ACTN
MNPQLWLGELVQRNQPSLARLRAYTEDALAEVIEIERGVCPQPASLPGEVIGMNVRNRVGLRAIESVDFCSGTLILKQVRNRGIRLIERGTGLEVRFRKVKAIPAVTEWPGRLPYRPVQELMFDWPIGNDGLPEGLSPVLVWSIGVDDQLGEFSALVVDNLDELDVATVFAVVDIESGLGNVGAFTQPSTSPAPVVDDFEDVVQKVPLPAEETGDTTAGA